MKELSKPGMGLVISHSVLASEEVRHVVEQHYPIGAVAQCYLLRRSFNEAYFLQAANGARYVARLSSIRARGPANVGYEVSMLAHLSSRGIGVAEPILPTSGATHVMLELPEGSRPLALFRFVEGDVPESLDDVELTGAELAKIHLNSQDYAGPSSLYRIDVDHLLKTPLTWLLQAPTVDAGLRDSLNALASSLDSSLAGMPDLTAVACHGDCHGANNFIWTRPDGVRVTSFFDFDDAGPGYLAYDLAVYLWSQLLRNALTAPDAEVSEKWSRFLGGYRAHGTVKAEDLAAIPLFVGIRHFWLLGEYASRRHHWGSQALPTSWLRKQAELLHSWQDFKLPVS